MAKKSAGLLMYRFAGDALEVLLAHPGGPFWAKKDIGAWSIPKGEYDDDEEPFEAAKREFQEELGIEAKGEFSDLGTIRQPSGKRIVAWAFENDCDPRAIVSNTFSMEWPPKSGKSQEFPEIDKADWFSIPIASRKILKGQRGFLESLCKLLDVEYKEIAEEKKEKKQPKTPEQGDLFG